MSIRLVTSILLTFIAHFFDLPGHWFAQCDGELLVAIPSIKLVWKRLIVDAVLHCGVRQDPKSHDRILPSKRELVGVVRDWQLACRLIAYSVRAIG